MPEAGKEQNPLMFRSPKDHGREGRVLKLTARGGVQGFETPDTDDGESVPRDVLIQPLSDPNGTNATVSFVIQWWRGEAKFSSPSLPMSSFNIKEYTVTARKVLVSFTMTQNVLGGAATDLAVSVAVARGQGGQKGPAASFPQWLQSAAPATRTGDLMPVGQLSARVFAGNVILKNGALGGGAALYLLLFTNVAPGALISGTTLPVPGGRSPGLLVNGQGVSLYNDQEPLEFSNNITYALSSTPDVYTAVGDGPTATVDLYAGG